MFCFQFSLSKGVSLTDTEIKKSLLSKTKIVCNPLPFSVSSELLALFLMAALNNWFVVYKQRCNCQAC